jgi:hypothetical protein
VSAAAPARRRFVGATLALACALLVAACRPTAAFDPGGPCLVNGTPVDGRAAGAYPDLERLVPRVFDGRPPDRLDSGRNCSGRNLGTMLDRGIQEVHFAGGLWEMGARSGVSLVVFRADGLTSTTLFEFYETGARLAPKTDGIETAALAVAGAAGHRLDTLNDESYQTVITWPGPSGEIRVVLVGTDIREVQNRAAHEARVAAALAAFGA